MTKQETWEEFEARVMRRARELVSGQPPEFNIAPTLELVRHAFMMGYDVRPAAEPEVPHIRTLIEHIEKAGYIYSYEPIFERARDALRTT